MKIVESLNNWAHKRKLKKLGFTEIAWRRYNDPDINRYANTVNEYYKGYPTKFIFDNTGIFKQYEKWTDGYDALQAWCAEKCKGKWRDDIHRVTKQYSLDLDGNSQTEWVFTEISGSDLLVVAFQDEQDAMLFTLRWL